MNVNICKFMYVHQRKAKLGLLALATLTSFAAYSSTPAFLTTICTLDETCSVDGDSIVGFGANDKFHYATLNGSFICNPSAFGISEDESSSESVCVIPHKLAASSSSSSINAYSTLPHSFITASQKYAIVSLSSGKALTMLGEAQSEPVIVQSNFEQEPDQLWQLLELDEGYFAITNAENTHAIGLQGWSKDEGAELLVTEWINSWHQQWQLQLLESGAFIITSRFSQKAIDVYEMNNFDNGSVRAWTYWGGENQHWLLIPVN